MFRLACFVAVISLALAGTLPEENLPDYDGRIVNGVDTSIEAHPYQVSIQTNAGSHFCGGSIINEDTIVTAAHCMQKYSASEFKIRLGSTDSRSGGKVVAVKAFRNHPKYNSKTKEFDVSVIKLAEKVKQTNSIRYIALAERTPKTDTPAVVTGWGTKCFLFCSASNTLQEVEVFIVDEKACASKRYKYGEEKILPTMVCAYDVKKDACQGDSGGPLVAESKLVGIVSWGNGCAKTDYPGVYCDVASVRDWINETERQL